MSIRDFRYTINGFGGSSLGWMALTWFGQPPGMLEFSIGAGLAFVVAAILTAPAFE
jgi:hypothetical protein